MIVTVTASDILKLVFGLGLNEDDILRALDFYILNDDQLIPNGLRDIPKVKTERGFAYVALKKMEGYSCIFLKDDLCMIHPLRPMVCSSFPFVFSEHDGSISWSLHVKQEICPGIGEGEIITDELLLEMSEEPIDELATFAKIVNIWNDSCEAHSASGFIRFLIEKSSKGT